MEKEINYPIKYAVLELKTRGGWSVGYEDITQGFIVSKCYVVESNIVYHSDGTNKLTHKVVFPFEDISCLQNSLMNGTQNIGEENIPSYDACNRPYPATVVTNLFDSYEAAKISAEEKNEEYKHILVLKVYAENLNRKEQFKKLKGEFDQKLKLCYLFEQLVLEATKDMRISEPISNNESKSSVKILKPMRKHIK